MVSVGETAAKIYEVLWMEEQLKHLEAYRENTLATLQNLGAESRDYSILLDRPNWVYAIRLLEVMTVIPALVVLGANFLRNKQK